MTAGKLTVLTGSYGHHGLLHPKDFDSNKKTNFTCRQLSEITDSKVCDSIIEAFSLKSSQKENIISKIKELAIENFSLKRMCDDAVQVYRNLLNEQKTSDIILSGYYGFLNSGDDAILKMIITEIIELR